MIRNLLENVGEVAVSVKDLVDVGLEEGDHPAGQGLRPDDLGIVVRIRDTGDSVDERGNKSHPAPRGSVQKRPGRVRSKPANGSGPELLGVVPDRELSQQGKSRLFPQSSKKI